RAGVGRHTHGPSARWPVQAASISSPAPPRAFLLTGDIMGRFIAGSISALLLVAAGLFWWQGRASQEQPALTAKADPQPAEESLPEADANVFDEAPPMPPSATMRTREERRFDRYDRNRDNIITRNELMASRTKDFRKLDTDSNNV